MSEMGRIERATRFPSGGIALGSEAHKALFCRMLLDTHDLSRPALFEWPKLDEATRGKIVSLPIWDIAVAAEAHAGMNMRTYGEGIADPLLRKAIEMNAFEESRHKRVLADMVTAYGIELAPQPEYKRPRDPEFAFMRTGYAKCIDSVFGFGLFRLARDRGFFPPVLVDMFEPVMREEGRHILFFVNWVAWWRRTMPWWRRPWFEAKVIAVWIALILERISMAKELGVEVSFPELARICLAENDRRLAPYDKRLIRPHFVPACVRLALRFARK